MKLQTQIPLKKADNPIGYQSRLLLLGSCFVENMGGKFDYFKFQALQNPFGILFHPTAIENLISRAIQQKPYVGEELSFHKERWFSFDAHSDLSDTSKAQLLDRLNKGLESVYQQILGSSHIIITLGTAWTYRYLEKNLLVANCHKVPQTEFSKELLPIAEVEKSLERIIHAIHTVNNKAQCIFTVSPVRHLKDGFVENQRSKSHLIAGLHHVINGRDVFYFPSYEVMMDELRDYRFYKSDMVHPNRLGIDYIWQKFKTVWVSESAHATMKKVDDVQKGLRHRPFHDDSEQHQNFLRSLNDKIMHLESEYPFMGFGKEGSRS